MLKYELKKYILKPSVIICLAVLLLVDLVKVLRFIVRVRADKFCFREKAGLK